MKPLTSASLVPRSLFTDLNEPSLSSSISAAPSLISPMPPRAPRSSSTSLSNLSRRGSQPSQPSMLVPPPGYEPKSPASAAPAPVSASADRDRNLSWRQHSNSSSPIPPQPRERKRERERERALSDTSTAVKFQSSPGAHLVRFPSLNSTKSQIAGIGETSSFALSAAVPSPPPGYSSPITQNQFFYPPMRRHSTPASPSTPHGVIGSRDRSQQHSPSFQAHTAQAQAHAQMQGPALGRPVSGPLTSTRPAHRAATSPLNLPSQAGGYKPLSLCVFLSRTFSLLCCIY